MPAPAPPANQPNPQEYSRCAPVRAAHAAPCPANPAGPHSSAWPAAGARRTPSRPTSCTPLPPLLRAMSCALHLGVHSRRRARSLLPGPSEPLLSPFCVRAVKALRAVHGRFYLDALPIGVGLVGPGLIGGTFLQQMHEQVGVGGRTSGRALGVGCKGKGKAPTWLPPSSTPSRQRPPPSKPLPGRTCTRAACAAVITMVLRILTSCTPTKTSPFPDRQAARRVPHGTARATSATTTPKP